MDGAGRGHSWYDGPSKTSFSLKTIKGLSHGPWGQKEAEKSRWKEVASDCEEQDPEFLMRLFNGGEGCWLRTLIWPELAWLCSVLWRALLLLLAQVSGAYVSALFLRTRPLSVWPWLKFEQLTKELIGGQKHKQITKDNKAFSHLSYYVIQNIPLNHNRCRLHIS